MDAEKFDKVVLDLLYDELDELTRASAIRHTEQSGRAKALYSELRATREVGALPLVEPPSDLEERILLAEERARAERPIGQRLGALVSIAASYAMRPQLGMAAVLLLMVGSSLLFLRVNPGGPASSVQVTERGVPESEKESSRVVPLAEAPRPADAPRLEPAPEMQRAARGRAEAAKGEAAARPAPNAQDKEGLSAAEQGLASPPADDLAFASPPPSEDGRGAASAPASPGAAAGGPVAATDEEGRKDTAPSSGCESDLARWETIMAAPSTNPYQSLEAARFAAAQCYARLGRVESARRTYRLLLTDPLYADQSRRALSILPEATGRVAEGAPAKPATKAARPAASKPAP